MHPADLIKISKHPAIVWFDRMCPVVCLFLAIYYAVGHSYEASGVWLATAILGFVLSVCNITKIMQKVLTKIVARRGR